MPMLAALQRRLMADDDLGPNWNPVVKINDRVIDQSKAP
jgi:hypothetical protein